MLLENFFPFFTRQNTCIDNGELVGDEELEIVGADSGCWLKNDHHGDQKTHSRREVSAEKPSQKHCSVCP